MLTQVPAELAATRLFSGIPARDLERLAERSRRRTYRRGHLIFSTGDPSDTLALVISGRVKVAVRSADGGELMLTILRPGWTFGELGVVDCGPRSADAEMLEGGELLLMPTAALEELRATHPIVSERLLEIIATSLRRLTEATADLVFLDLPRRLAKLLVDQPRSAQGEVDLALNQEQVASMVGGSRQSVNSALRGFERRGWITAKGPLITLDNIEALTRFAGPRTIDVRSVG